VLVTGGSSGVGRSLAIEIARRGGRVLATARRADRLAAVAAEPAAHPIAVVAGDVTDEAFRGALPGEAARRLGGLDVVIAAAGAGAVGPFRDGSAATAARVWALDVVAPLELVRDCLPLLAASADPAVVLVGSILGIHPLPGHAEYCAAKAAIRSLAGTLRVELAPEGIDVLLASLGPTESEFWDSLLAGSRPAWSRGRPLPAAAAARAIVAGLERRRAEVIPGWQARGYALCGRLLPGLIDWAVSRRL
jgi:short-subunit dehydrogenase